MKSYLGVAAIVTLFALTQGVPGQQVDPAEIADLEFELFGEEEQVTRSPEQEREERVFASRIGKVRDLARMRLTESPMFLTTVLAELEITEKEQERLSEIVVKHPADMITEKWGSNRSFYNSSNEVFEEGLGYLKKEMDAEEARQTAAIKEIIGKEKLKKLQKLYFETRIDEYPFKALLAVGISPTDAEVREIKKVYETERHSRRAFKQKLLETIESLYGERLESELAEAKKQTKSLPVVANRIDMIRFFGGIHHRLQRTYPPPRAKCAECQLPIATSEPGYRIANESFHEYCLYDAVFRKPNKEVPAKTKRTVNGRLRGRE